MDRKTFIKHALTGALLANTFPAAAFWNFSSPYPVSQITSAPKQHWFGYYDKWQIDPTGRYALGMEVDLFFRSPKPDDELKIGIIDLENNNQWKTIGTSSAWGWQQGCMLQWIPGSTEEVIWNDRQNGQYISRVYNIKTGEERVLPKPIYALSPNGDYAIGTAFNRIQNMRPGYGYAGIPDPYSDVKAPEDNGIYKMNLDTGEQKQVISLDQVSKISHQGQSIEDY